MKLRTVLLSAALLGATASAAPAQPAADTSLGSAHFPISCGAVQESFDRAILMLSNFAYPDTVKAFRAISEQAPYCAIAYWGIAISEMPNPLSPPFPPGNLDEGWAAIQKGKAAKTQTPREGDYLAAIETFYEHYDTVAYHSRALRYEEAMQRLHEHYPDDVEAAVLYALALNMAIDLDDRTYSRQLKAAAVLNAVAKSNPDNPGIWHFLIHSYDFPPLAAMALPAARHYDKIASGSVHALHMPSHIYSMLGMWPESIRSNLAAKALLEKQAGEGFNPAWEAHLLDFLECAYLQLAQDGAAKRIADMAPAPTKREFFSLTTDTALAAIPARYVLERGRWDEAARLPVGDSAYPAAQAISYFARALGAARSGDRDGARSEIARLDQAEKALSAAHNDYWAAQTLIKKQAAAAWLMFAEGNGDAAISAMRAAAERDDASEKTVAMENKLLPLRELLGELYMAAKRYRQALAEFEASNKAYPNRFRTLAGAAASARAAGETGIARHYYQTLLTLAKDGDGDRPAMTEAKEYLAQRR